MALISPARFRFRFRFGLRCARRPAVVALALSAVLGGCDPLDDGSAQRDTADAADAASAASAPEPASGWRFTRIRAPADAAMAARAERDARLSARHGGAAAGGGASDAQASASAASGTGAAVPDASAHDDVRRPLVAATAADADAALIERGRYLAHAGDCSACHDAADHTPYAGGQPVNSPFGPIYAPNITPDPVHGIGRYTLQQFDDALRRGVRADGSNLYPAMPYASFARLHPDDVRALYAYFMHGVAPSPQAGKRTALPFPFNQRWALGLWRLVFANDERFVPSPSRSASWNRGAYLVQGLGHCGACHTPRGPAYNERGYDERSAKFLTGGVTDHWFAPNLTGADHDGLGRWSVDDIAAFLRDGHTRHGSVFGAMAPVVGESTALLTDGDRHAIAVYLKSLPAQPTAATNPLGVGMPRLTAAGPRPEGGQQAPGAGVYASFCARCHGVDGTGIPHHGPPLAGNPVVVAADPTSAIRIVVEGARPALGERDRSGVQRMPAMRGALTSSEIAAVVSYVRGAWGNRAAPVSTQDVRRLRAAIHR
ncbi:cytochrome c [Burkholderia multivorans]|uniref:cytochrome c n=1 Tax=Burkholderia multivorans TaxID=87883 RepID=UPI0021BE6F2C|nr:cytochrome c [Burkholderia multivorans]MDR8761685.1 Alcohol dehydrogenase (quinone), cytochrome c subunit [Burkholderia multivorans]MDR8767728.1 Alcohol dehydrogenase (quinone), cytochrome c subunit [Burkholderia multivorans]MDR8771803.1 Alcohol dehydrogenase (quinone), cytochrome c subunit [Burkholderia multivorans]MDR8790764.1 Alcohol dehydrogenase (quinone), cytochrome c subunit [Burkholderia multivorans]MDR8798412.1 Alcohol dehydrogenase (quinone), cytochrome c subunit [Burkholderia mul